MKTMAERVRERREILKLTQAELAELVGCSQPQITKIERGGNTTLLLELAKALQVNVDWLKYGVESSDNSQQTGEEVMATEKALGNDVLARSTQGTIPITGLAGRGDAYIFLPRLVAKPSEIGGKLAWEIDLAGELQAFPRVQAERLHIRETTSAFITAPDNSMAPRILGGDSLVIDHADVQIADGQVYALIYGNTLTVRRLFEQPGVYTVAPDNTSDGRFRAFTINAEDIAKIEIVGRIKAVIGSI